MRIERLSGPHTDCSLFKYRPAPDEDVFAPGFFLRFPSVRVGDIIIVSDGKQIVLLEAQAADDKPTPRKKNLKLIEE